MLMLASLLFGGCELDGGAEAGEVDLLAGLGEGVRLHVPLLGERRGLTRLPLSPLVLVPIENANRTPRPSIETRSDVLHRLATCIRKRWIGRPGLSVDRIVGPDEEIV